VSVALPFWAKTSTSRLQAHLLNCRSVARITVVRGTGPMEGSELNIDSQIVQVLTSYSDLDSSQTISRKFRVKPSGATNGGFSNK